MKFNIKEHPQIFLFLISLFMLILSIVLNVIYHFAIYAIFMLVLACIASAVLGFSFFYDLYLFCRKKNEYEATHHQKENGDD